MEKKVNYRGKEYTIEIKWSGSSYCVRCVENGSRFYNIPNECIENIERVKPYIMFSITNKHDLKIIELWDGNL